MPFVQLPHKYKILDSLHHKILSDLKLYQYKLLFFLFVYLQLLILFALSSIFAVSLAMMVVVGAVLQIFHTTNITLVQMRVPDYIRGRVMGIRYIIMGAGTLGILLLGVAAEVFGPAVALVLMGLFALVLVMLIFPNTWCTGWKRWVLFLEKSRS